jgi:hypothetical protein
VSNWLQGDPSREFDSVPAECGPCSILTGKRVHAGSLVHYGKLPQSRTGMQLKIGRKAVETGSYACETSDAGQRCVVQLGYAAPRLPVSVMQDILGCNSMWLGGNMGLR